MSGDDGLPAGWLLVPLAELLTGIDTGKSFKCDERPPTVDEIGVVKISAVTWGRYQEQESKTCMDAERVNPALFVQPGDFLFSRANTIELVGACVIAQQVNLRVMLSDKILRFRFVTEAIKPWVLRLLRSEQGRKQIEALASGNQDSMRNIGQERIGRILVPLPPAAERPRIVDKLEELLSDLDAGVAELKAAQKKLGQYRQSLLKAAVEGRLTEGWRAEQRNTGASEESGARLLTRILRERRARWEAKQLAKFDAQGKTPPKGWQDNYLESMTANEAELPALPQGWVWATVDSLLSEIETGKSFKCEERPPRANEIGVAKVSAVSWGEYNEQESKTCLDAEKVNPALFVHAGDFLFSRANTVELVGACVIAQQTSMRVMLSDKTLRFVFVVEQLKHWLLFFLRSEFGRLQIELLSSGNQESMRNIGQERIRQIAVPLPPPAELDDAIGNLVAALEGATKPDRAITASLRQSAAQRKNILQSAFSGQLVPQDPNDEPASVLLARIRTERALQDAAGGPKRRTRKSAAS